MKSSVLILAISLLALAGALTFLSIPGCQDIVDVKNRVLPEKIRLSWQHDPRTTVTVVWETGEPVPAGIEYGTTASYGGCLKAQAIANPDGAPDATLHIAGITGLAPDTTYHYRCGGRHGWSEEGTFTTAPADEQPFVFLAGGDTKNATGICASLLEMGMTCDPSLLVYLADAVDQGTPACWHGWFKAISPFAGAIPVMPCVGNHEVSGDPELANYMHYNVLPQGSGSELYYSFDYSFVHFVSVDCMNLDQNQLDWLETDLALTAKKWKIVFLHKPLFSSGPYGSNEVSKALLCPIFDKYGVAVVFCGHDHTYERSKPINYTFSQDSPQASYQNATCYIVSGGMGASLYDTTPGNWWTAASQKCYHLCKVAVSQNTLEITAIDLQGNIFDSVTITK